MPGFSSILFLFALLPTHAIPSVRGATVPLVALTEISPSFRSQMQTAATTIPVSVWHRLQDRGWRVRLARFVIDADTSLIGRQPRGWPLSATWENADAVHLPSSRMLVFAEKRHNSRGAVVDCTRMPGVLRHEIGHAWDMTWESPGMYSSQPQFRQAYHADLQVLPEGLRHELAYYLQPGRAGRQETLAEAFALTLGGGSDTDHQREFIEAFPRVMRLLREQLSVARNPTASTE